MRPHQKQIASAVEANECQAVVSVRAGVSEITSAPLIEHLAIHFLSQRE